MLKAKQHGPDNSALIRWLKTFVVHFLAKRTLEKRSSDFPTEEVTFSIIAVNRSPVGVKTSWSAMKDIISETMAGHEPDKVIEELKEKIQSTKGTDPKGKLAGTLRNIMRTPVEFFLGLHAEILLATLGSKQCRETAFGNKDGPLKELCEVQWHTLIMLVLHWRA